MRARRTSHHRSPVGERNGRRNAHPQEEEGYRQTNIIYNLKLTRKEKLTTHFCSQYSNRINFPKGSEISTSVLIPPPPPPAQSVIITSFLIPPSTQSEIIASFLIPPSTHNEIITFVLIPPSEQSEIVTSVLILPQHAQNEIISSVLTLPSAQNEIITPVLTPPHPHHHHHKVRLLRPFLFRPCPRTQSEFNTLGVIPPPLFPK